jgi:hypothetical protein
MNAPALQLTPRSRFSTSTVLDTGSLVPWLAAKGPLAYTPAAPPARDYFFQYTWILPGLFEPQINRREHRYFGSPIKDYADFLFDFWTEAGNRGGGLQPQSYQLGFFSDVELRAPIAAYAYLHKPFRQRGSLLIQHGSYQWISCEAQPHIEQGQVLLYRGIGKSTVFRCLRFQPTDLSASNREIWRKYLGLQAAMLSDSVLSFNTIHDRLKRSETAGLRDGTCLADDLAKQAGLDIDSAGFAQELWNAAQQGYSLERRSDSGSSVPTTSCSRARSATFASQLSSPASRK